MPAEVKKHFFTGKEQPNLAEYDVIGFDADCCIVKYNTRALMVHINEITGRDMHLAGGWPEQLAHFDDKTIGMAMNCAVWDIERGNIIKLVGDKLVARGYHGTRQLTQ